MIPVARCMLQSGIGLREFSKISKIAFIKVATADYGIRGRPTNISRVAVMTDLTRKEVKKVSAGQVRGMPAVSGYQEEVLRQGWMEI